MRPFRTAHLVVAVVVACLLGLPRASDAAKFQYEPESNLKFHGVSTIRHWTCDTVPVEGRLELPFRIESREDLLSKLEGFEPGGFLRIPVDSIDCGESGFFNHNHNLYRTLKGDTYPYVTFDPVVTRDVRWETGVRATVIGKLTIADTTQEASIPLSITVDKENRLRVMGEFTVSLKKYGLSPPQLMLGMISIYDTVRITVDLLLYVDEPMPPSRDNPVEKGTRPSGPYRKKPEGS